MKALLIALAFTAACASAASKQQVRGSLGYTDCVPPGGVARSWIRVEVVGGPDQAAVIDHELVHGAQVRRFERCEDFLGWYLTNIADAEAEAFCASAIADVREHPERYTLDGAMVKYARTLAVAYPNVRITVEDAFAKIAHYCAAARGRQ